jgi:choline dehydrogenase
MTKDGSRASSAKTHLKSALDRPNLTVLLYSHVRKILVDNQRARGVSVKRLGDVRNIYARREVIVSAGTVESPKLLMLSGIGPRQHLEEMGIQGGNSPKFLRSIC